MIKTKLDLECISPKQVYSILGGLFIFSILLRFILKYYFYDTFLDWASYLSLPISFILLILLLLNKTKNGVLFIVTNSFLDFLKEIVIIGLGFILIRYFWEFMLARDEFIEKIFGFILLKFIFIAFILYFIIDITNRSIIINQKR